MKTTFFQNLDSFDLNQFISGAFDHDFMIPVTLGRMGNDASNRYWIGCQAAWAQGPEATN